VRPAMRFPTVLEKRGFGGGRIVCEMPLIVCANARLDKAPVLIEIREEVEELKVLLRLCLREPDAAPRPASRGVDFVGWNTFWNHRRPHTHIFVLHPRCVAAVSAYAWRWMW